MFLNDVSISINIFTTRPTKSAYTKLMESSENRQTHYCFFYQGFYVNQDSWFLDMIIPHYQNAPPIAQLFSDSYMVKQKINSADKPYVTWRRISPR